jgi:hypothetical protein
MSAPLAGKFQDHYQVLGIDSKSDSGTIQAAYTKLAQKFHSRNKDTGNQEKFEAVNLAYEILSNPALRQEFDKLKGIDQKEGPPKFSGLEFFDAMGRDAAVRLAVLCVLYDRRRTKPFTPSLSMRHMEALLDVKIEELNFALWYLKYRGFAASDDKSSLVITVDGINYLETNKPSPEVVMPLIRQAPVEEPRADAPEKAAINGAPVSPAAADRTQAADKESVHNILSRALGKR